MKKTLQNGNNRYLKLILPFFLFAILVSRAAGLFVKHGTAVRNKLPRRVQPPPSSARHGIQSDTAEKAQLVTQGQRAPFFFVKTL